VAKNKLLGVLGFFTSEEHEFGVEAVEFLSTMAGQAAIAIHNSQLYEKTLEQAFELHESIKVKDDFLGVVSHELRTPVNVIMGYTNILSERFLGELTDGQESALARIAICAEDLASIIDDMLQVVTIDNKSAAAATIELDLGYFIEELRAGYSTRFGRDLKLDWTYPADLPVIYTDCDKLKHILKHLIGNAIKFTPNEGVVVSVRYLQGNSAVEFQIEDTGVGIPDEVLPKIFDKFYQGDSTMNRSHGGCGLGLYIVKRLTELLGGHLAVKSEVGKGSVFALTFPIAECDNTEHHKQKGVSPIL
jgi:signal transduction histidine kinase